MTSYTVTYFDSRGRAEPIRLLLAYAGLPFEDRGLSYDEWTKHKADSPLGQLPYLVERGEGEMRVVPQAMAILRHLAREHGLDGKTEGERLAADVACETAVDLRAAQSSLRFSPAWQDEDAKAKFVAETVPPHLARIEKLLGARAWIAASTPTYADLFVFDTLDRLVVVWPKVLEGHPELGAFYERVSGLPQLAKYLASRRPA